MLGLERRHRERAGAIRINRHRRAEAVLPHQRAETREQRGQLLRRRLRAREERVLQDAARRGLIAPLRDLRVPPVAAINSVPIVGGDFDQEVLAKTL